MLNELLIHLTSLRRHVLRGEALYRQGMNHMNEREPGTRTDLPLDGCVVIEIGHSVAAPYAGLVLAELGADVIKVERPEVGDDARAWGPPFVNDMSAIFHALNRHKKSIAVDLKSREGVGKSAPKLRGPPMSSFRISGRGWRASWGSAKTFFAPTIHGWSMPRSTPSASQDRWHKDLATIR